MRLWKIQGVFYSWISQLPSGLECLSFHFSKASPGKILIRFFSSLFWEIWTEIFQNILLYGPIWPRLAPRGFIRPHMALFVTYRPVLSYVALYDSVWYGIFYQSLSLEKMLPTHFGFCTFHSTFLKPNYISLNVLVQFESPMSQRVK